MSVLHHGGIVIIPGSSGRRCDDKNPGYGCAGAGCGTGCAEKIQFSGSALLYCAGCYFNCLCHDVVIDNMVRQAVL